MEHHRLSGSSERRFLLVFADGEDVVRGLVGFAREQEIAAAEFTGVGSLADVQLDGRGRFSDDDQRLDVRPLDGTVLFSDEGARVHIDVVVAPLHGERRSGRMTSGRVRNALKLVFTEVPADEIASASALRPAR